MARPGSTAAALAALAVLASCSSTSGGPAPAGGDSASSAAAPSRATSSAGASSGAGADLKVADSSLGRIVVDRQGRTAYYYDQDEAGSGTSTCSGGCLAAWPARAARNGWRSAWSPPRR